MKKIITEAVLVPNKVIVRGDYNIYFSNETIAKMHKNFHTKKSFSRDEENDLNNVDILESWIIESENDKAYQLGFDYPLGTWMMTAKATKDAINGFTIDNLPLNTDEVTFEKNN